MVLSQTLEETHAEIVGANSGDEALLACLNNDFSLAILDVHMPGMDGYELSGFLRDDRRTAHLPIIFLTAAYSESSQVFRGYEAGAVDYIVKPFDPDILLGKVRVFLELDLHRKELVQHREKLAAANRELEAFSYSVSHDLQAPLRAINGFSQALLEDCPEKLNDEEREYLRRISDEATRMARLIEDLLSLSRVSRTDIQPQAVDLGLLAEKVVARLQEAEPERRVDVSIGDDLVVFGDLQLLARVMENLLSNAWKFTGLSNPARIEVGRTTERAEAAFFVRDNGAGFDMKYSDKLFRPFQRLHSTESFPGTGIGLSIVQRVVSRHGGRVWCESQIGKGTTFYFTLETKA